jgi:hypothetical protein
VLLVFAISGREEMAVKQNTKAKIVAKNRFFFIVKTPLY